MANKVIDVVITTPKGIYFESKASIATFSTTEGQIGLMNGALPFIAALVPSQIIIKTEQGKDNKIFYIDQGIVEFKDNLLSLIVSHIDTKPINLEINFKQDIQKKHDVIEELILKKKIAEQKK
ncbi:F0F1 ATP synthase subunit epsilon [Mycoplasma enhydrae]|uniref:F0F1 ATP synthase subunit epsilon n=1 Tax=Mycoplasma enhydrae TaxID=2499220 RepID=UPI00197C18EB|nr:F0F1 ATP synthase subunit epsilon [Mycoplasma enhydrae]MBN4089246.1 F0F1 ATP synthase subunit epsilon [Mycoplasma enhydrae]